MLRLYVNKYRWVSLIEILVAIVVFSVWVITILAVISKNLFVIDKVRNRTTATFIAKEWIELVYNIRDSNLDKWVLRNCTQLNSTFDCTDKFEDWDYYKISIDPEWYHIIESTTALYEDNKLFYHEKLFKDSINAPIVEWFWYDYNPTDWEETIFSRVIRINWIHLEPEWSVTNQDRVLKVESVVEFKKWFYTWNVIIESIIWDI